LIVRTHALAEKFLLYLITDDQGRSPQTLASLIEAAVRGGVTAVQIREKHAPHDVLKELILRASPICRHHGALLLLNATLWRDDLPLDLLDGLHLQNATWPAAPEAEPAQWIRSRHDLVLAYSAHSIEEMKTISATGVPVMTLSPIFDTPSKAGILEPLGPQSLVEARAALPDTVIVALGGISEQNVAQVINHGADGVALIRALLHAPNVEFAARRLRQELQKALQQRVPREK
jgi:thiamine-phosphate pyrophosphorylase